MQNLGKRLKALRNQRGLTLAQLGQRVDLSASNLSQIERGVTMPSLPRLTSIAEALDVEVGYFFEDDVSPPCVVRASQSERMVSDADAMVELLAADPSGKKIQPFRIVCKPGTVRDDLPTHQGEVCGFVLEGQLTITVGAETHILEAGDSIHYQTLQPHSWRNDGVQECVFIWTVSPPVPEPGLQG